MSGLSWLCAGRCLRRVPMSFAVCLVLLCILCTSYSGAERGYEVGDVMPGVVQLVEQNVTKYIGGSKAVFMEIYAPWCAHCKSTASEMAALGRVLQNSTSDMDHLIVAKMDATQNENAVNHFGIGALPTFLFFPADSKQPQRYYGGNTVDEFIEFFRRKVPNLQMRNSQPPSHLIDVNANFDDIDNDTARHRLVLFHAPWCEHCKRFMPELNNLAALYVRDRAEIAFLRVNAVDEVNQKATKQMKIDGFPTLLYIPKGHGASKASQYRGERSTAAMLNYLHRKTGVMRLLDGDYSWSHGVQSALARQIASITYKPKDRAAKALTELRARLLKTAQNTSTLYYLDAAQHMVDDDDGVQFINSEYEHFHEQLQTMPQGAARDDVVIKFNVLRSLLQHVYRTN